MRNLPIGIQTFEGIVKGEYVYVDKTRYLYELVKAGIRPDAGSPKFFLSRPRRFGKSLTISTLEALFLGKRSLFEGLWITQNTDYAFEQFPVIRIDMSKVGGAVGDELNRQLCEQIRVVGEIHAIAVEPDPNAGIYFERLIRTLATHRSGRVVILVDEYDKPIIDHITRSEHAAINRDILRQFYSVIKAMDAHMRFVLLTGVSKFSKVSVFSGLNNLEDLTMQTAYAGMLGYTQEELEFNFKAHSDALAEAEQLTLPETLEKIKHWYNGYRFSKADTKVYNPFSTLLLLKQQDFKAHWFETGTPTFLVELLKQTGFDMAHVSELEVDESAFSTYDIENLDPMALLFQTGYLTIRDYDRETGRYRLHYPNREVAAAFSDALLSGFSENTPSVSQSHLARLERSLKAADLETFFDTLKVFFAKIPYTIQLKNEKYYQTIFYLIFTLIGLRIRAEVTTNKGRIDAVVETEKEIFIFEFKLQGTAEEALQQILDKGYGQKYQGKNKVIRLFGVSFDPQERNIGRWVESL
ncbi:MAG: ATP-binding protein [Candidatus Margulisiibacteriota bacterium]